ncbi:phasin family domain-containing protein [Advenella kashmirensis WT001]|jgi:phasin family protein|uniref:Phasin family domain-containing protein n=1 Tax=Advenella kashmirensis (strain DSM 17095 / LMG 22695 / WT001) TaxID=1036672 RepID=I3UES7_ADVKW|nr:TIGR01841 family phasin [Advenella kashmirensis]AFK63515.1 phasin family domain-containing protein [Advenella kashmirensis WT001]HLU04594.1 TIGR01841 family phasin [Advenella sp.]
MSAIPQQILDRQKSALNAAVAVQGSLFSGFEKLVDLNLKVIKATLGEVAEQTQQVAELKDPQEAAAYVSSLAQPNSEKAIAYTKHVYDIVSGVSNELIKLTEAQVAEGQQQVSEAIDQLAKNAPTGSESAVALMKSSLATVSTAYDSMNKAAKQAAEVAESNISAATNATIKATETATKAAATASRSTARRQA